MDSLALDGCKLQYHPERVAQWRSGDKIYPIYVEVSPTGACNYRCKFCALDFMGYENVRLDTEKMRSVFIDMSNLGIESIMFGGEGEPLLHPEFARLVYYGWEAGLDMALTTNASLLTEKVIREIIPYMTWIKASVDAATPETYALLHGTKPDMFNRVIENMATASRVRKEGIPDFNIPYPCTLGMQMLLLPENADEVEQLGQIARDIGMDYLVVKPYSQHPASGNTQYAGIDYKGFKQKQDGFIQYRTNAIARASETERPYDECLALPFWGYIDSRGNVWGCSAHIGEDHFKYGNIYQSSFKHIWDKNYLRHYPAEGCRKNCRMDACNRYLWGLDHPPRHVNFI